MQAQGRGTNWTVLKGWGVMSGESEMNLEAVWVAGEGYIPAERGRSKADDCGLGEKLAAGRADPRLPIQERSKGGVRLVSELGRPAFGGKSAWAKDQDQTRNRQEYSTARQRAGPTRLEPVRFVLKLAVR